MHDRDPRLCHTLRLPHRYLPASSACFALTSLVPHDNRPPSGNRASTASIGNTEAKFWMITRRAALREVPVVAAFRRPWQESVPLAFAFGAIQSRDGEQSG